MHNLIGYIGTTEDHLASSTAALHSDSPTTSTTDGTSTNKAGDQTAKQQEEEQEEERGSESSKEDSEGESEGGKEEGGEGEKEGEEEGKEGEGEGEILEYKPLPEVLKVEVEKWRSSLNYAIDSQDTQTTEKVVYMTYIRSSTFWQVSLSM